jgi:hypothetical protein
MEQLGPIELALSQAVAGLSVSLAERSVTRPLSVPMKMR